MISAWQVFSVIALAAGSVAAAQEDVSLPMGGLATYVGNEGVVISYGDVKIMVDGLYDDGLGDYVETPADLRAAMIAGEPPYDGVSDVFVTHAHADHYGPDAMIAYLGAQPDVYAVVPADLRTPDVVTEVGGLDPDVLPQLVPLAGRDGEATPVSHGPGYSWRALQIPHGDRQHFAYWFALPAIPRTADEARDNGVQQSDLVILHLGDTDDYPQDLEPFRALLAETPVDAAFVPYWLLDEPGLADLLNARSLIGIHVPEAGGGALDPETMDWFRTPGEQRVIYKNIEGE